MHLCSGTPTRWVSGKLEHHSYFTAMMKKNLSYESKNSIRTLHLKKVRSSQYWNHFVCFSFRNSCTLLLYFVHFQHQNEDHLTTETFLTVPIWPNCEVLLYCTYVCTYVLQLFYTTHTSHPTKKNIISIKITLILQSN